jgi:hypothetical protein
MQKQRNRGKKPKKEQITTIKLKHETKARLDNLKEFERESYDEIIKKILFVLNTARSSPETAQGILRNIDSKLRRKMQVSFGIPEEKKVQQKETMQRLLLQQKPEQNKYSQENMPKQTEKQNPGKPGIQLKTILRK